jgi:GAF domain-containing protein
MRGEFNDILNRVRACPESGRKLRDFAMVQLDTISGYDWSGIYVLDGTTLHLDAFVGAPTDHTQIPIGVGVCGTAIAENRNRVVEDVRKEDNYLACSIATRSEIVVLIRRHGQVVGQIDIDSHRVGAFTTEDEEFLSELAHLLALRWDDAG